MRDYVTLVCGLPRSGTSLLMQMLCAGGVPIFDPDEAAHPFFETRQVRLARRWDLDAIGCTAKLLAPSRWPPPKAGRYKFIITRRNPRQQARSTAKFLHMGCTQGRTILLGKPQVREAEIGIKRDQATLESLLAGYDAPVLHVRFKTLVTKPELVVRDLDAFVGPLDCAAALERVIPRSPKCLPGMLEHDELGASLPPWPDPA